MHSSSVPRCTVIRTIEFQVCAGLLNIMVGRLNIDVETDRKKAEKLHDVITALVFVITVSNVMLNVFGR